MKKFNVKIEKVIVLTNSHGINTFQVRLTRKETFKVLNKDNKEEKIEFDSVLFDNHVSKITHGKGSIITLEPKGNGELEFVGYRNKGEKIKFPSKCSCGAEWSHVESIDAKVCTGLFCPYKSSTHVRRFLMFIGDEHLKKDEHQFIQTLLTYLQGFPSAGADLASVTNLGAFLTLFKQAGKKNTNSRFELLKKAFGDNAEMLWKLECQVEEFLETEKILPLSLFPLVFNLPFISIEDAKEFSKILKIEHLMDRANSIPKLKRDLAMVPASLKAKASLVNNLGYYASVVHLFSNYAKT